jgi:hypothetical protein
MNTNPFTSRKLIGSVVAMISIAGTVIGCVGLGIEDAVIAEVSIAGVTANVLFWAIALIASLGGFQILQQARVDANGSKTG